MFRADAHFRMGASHESEGSPCQDYALAENSVRPFAIVSDGCSTSGRTDIGARLWCLASRRALTLHVQGHCLGDMAVFQATSWMESLSLDYADMDATLGIVFQEPDKRIRTILLGDGVIAVKRNGCLEIISVEWAGNMPGYPSYRMNTERSRAFVSQSEYFAAGAEGATSVTWQTIHDTGEASSNTERRNATDGLRGIDISWGGDIEIVAVMTDGTGQVSGLDPQTAVTDLMSIGPARQGAFARRRLNAALKRWAKDNHWPVDDISMAVLARVDDV